MEDIIKRYDELYENMATSKDPTKMRIFGEAEKWAIRKMHELNPRYAQMWVEMLEPSCWDNYLSQKEAEDAVAGLAWANGGRGPKWSISQFEAAVAATGGKVESTPAYNKWALWAMANMLYAMQVKTLGELASESSIPKVIYAMSVNMLAGPKPMRIRQMLGL